MRSCLLENSNLILFLVCTAEFYTFQPFLYGSSTFTSKFKIVFYKNLNFLLKNNIFLYVLNCFNALILKIIFKK
jgi:hypothetical protein